MVLEWSDLSAKDEEDLEGPSANSLNAYLSADLRGNLSSNVSSMGWDFCSDALPTRKVKQFGAFGVGIAVEPTGTASESHARFMKIEKCLTVEKVSLRCAILIVVFEDYPLPWEGINLNENVLHCACRQASSARV